MTTVKRKRIDDGSVMPVVPKTQETVFRSILNPGSDINWTNENTLDFNSITITTPGVYQLTSIAQFIHLSSITAITTYIVIRNVNTANASGSVPGALVETMSPYALDGLRDTYVGSTIVDVPTVPMTFYTTALSDGPVTGGNTVLIDASFTSRFPTSDQRPIMIAVRVGDIL